MSLHKRLEDLDIIRFEMFVDFDEIFPLGWL